MPIIQLKPEHNHPKVKSITTSNHVPEIIQNPMDSQSIQSNLKNINNSNSILIKLQQQSFINSDKQLRFINQDKQLRINKQQKPTLNQSKQKQPIIKSQQKPKRQQKTLNVQILNHQVQQKLLQSSTQPQTTIQDNIKSKKKKKNKKKLIQQIDEVSPSQKLKIKTQELYSTFMQKHQLKYNSYHPEMMGLLKQSFIPFAESELKQEAAIQQQTQQLVKNSNKRNSNNFNRVHIYNEFLLNELKLRKSFHEDRIYFGTLQQNQLFNDLIWRKEIQSQVKKDEVALLFNDIHMLVINDVWEGEYTIHQKQKPSKDEIIYGAYKANQIRLAQTIIKEKLANLNDQFLVNQEAVANNDTNIDDTHNHHIDEHKFNSYRKFDLNSQETKKAQQFVKRLQQQQKLIKQKSRKAKLLQQEQQSMRIQQQQQQQRKLQQKIIHQRRIKLTQQAQERERQKQHRHQQQQLYQQYLIQHRQKTPLFKKKQQQLNQFLIKQRMRKFQVLKQLQKSKRSISKNEIEMHQLKYKQLKQLLQQQRQQMIKLQQQQIQTNKLTFYKSKFHDSVLLSQVDTKTIMQMKRNKLQQLNTKRLEYSTIVKSNFVPKIDIKKKEQLQRLIKDLKPKRQRDDQYVAEKTKMEGISNLEKLHLMLAQMKAKGKIKQPSSSMQQPQIKKSRYVNYLNEIKTSRMMNSQSMGRSRFTSLDVTKMNRNSLGLIELQARNLQQSADRKSVFLRNTKNMDMEDYLEKKFQLEQDYIQSARAKLKVLSKYELGD